MYCWCYKYFCNVNSDHSNVNVISNNNSCSNKNLLVNLILLLLFNAIELTLLLYDNTTDDDDDNDVNPFTILRTHSNTSTYIDSTTLFIFVNSYSINWDKLW